ncbi:MAG: NAD(P)/FAD-dependent oxidoreductase, partial [Planctomycetota bacterium]|nr:NAD(P)/FAD-dependent oxidoreductase [Planctomycetota bacterium]
EFNRHAPGIADHIVAREILTPDDLAAEYALPTGHPFHGEHALDQLLGLRPAPDLDRLPGGLLLASGGTHPGGGLTGIPGSLAASAASAAPRAKSSRA